MICNILSHSSNTVSLLGIPYHLFACFSQNVPALRAFIVKKISLFPCVLVIESIFSYYTVEIQTPKGKAEMKHSVPETKKRYVSVAAKMMPVLQYVDAETVFRPKINFLQAFFKIVNLTKKYTCFDSGFNSVAAIAGSSTISGRKPLL